LQRRVTSKLPQLEVMIEAAHVLVSARRVTSIFSYIKASSRQFLMPVNVKIWYEKHGWWWKCIPFYEVQVVEEVEVNMYYLE
jgi:hypothetical protein